MTPLPSRELNLKLVHLTDTRPSGAAEEVSERMTWVLTSEAWVPTSMVVVQRSLVCLTKLSDSKENKNQQNIIHTDLEDTGAG